MKVTQRKTRWRWDGEAFLARHFTIFDAFFCCSWTSMSTVSLALLRVAVAAVTILQWQIIKGVWPSSASVMGNVSEGNVSLAWLHDCNLCQNIICSHHAKDCYMCMCYWFLSIDSLKTAERTYLLPHTWIMGKMIHISICSGPDGTA